MSKLKSRIFCEYTHGDAGRHDNIDDGVDLMPPPKTFYRAIDTKEKDIEIPEYIDDRGYDYWK